MNIDKTKKNSIRKAFGRTLAELGGYNPNIVVLDADCYAQHKQKCLKTNILTGFLTAELQNKI